MCYRDCLTVGVLTTWPCRCYFHTCILGGWQEVAKPMFFQTFICNTNQPLFSVNITIVQYFTPQKKTHKKHIHTIKNIQGLCLFTPFCPARTHCPRGRWRKWQSTPQQHKLLLMPWFPPMFLTGAMCLPSSSASSSSRTFSLGARRKLCRMHAATTSGSTFLGCRLILNAKGIFNYHPCSWESVVENPLPVDEVLSWVGSH